MSKHVLIVSPGGVDLPGGVGRLVDYTIAAWADQPDAPLYRLVDPRGAHQVFWFPFYLARALAIVVSDAIRDRISLLHVHISARLSTVRKLAVVFAVAPFQVPVLLHLHDGGYDRFFDGLPTLGQYLVRLAFQRAQRVVVLGQATKRYVVDVLGVSEARVIVMHNAVPNPPRGSSEAIRSTADPCRILFLGRLGPAKGVPELLAALADPDVSVLSWRAVLAGDGDADRFRQMAHERGLADRLTFPGWLDRPQVMQLLSQADILVLPSHAEGLPMSVLEGMAYGLTVIATPVGAVPEAIADHESGLLVPVNDPSALARALRDAIGSAELRARLGGRAQQRFLDSFEIKGYAVRLAALYREIGADLAAGK